MLPLILIMIQTPKNHRAILVCASNGMRLAPALSSHD